MDKVERLLSEVKKHNKRYLSGRATISNDEYDALVCELRRIDPDNGWFRREREDDLPVVRKAKLKMPKESVCVVTGLSWKINRFGELRPIIHTEPIDGGNYRLKNPTGHNAKWIRDHHIAKGAKVFVAQYGGEIKELLERGSSTIEEDRIWDGIRHCPYCGSPTKWDNRETNLLCTNPNCLGIHFARIISFFKITKARYLKEYALSIFFRSGYKTLKDILNITPEEMNDISRLTQTARNEILQSIENIRAGVEITKLMHASGCFQGIGQEKSRIILSQLPEEQRYAFYNGRLHTWESNEELIEYGAFHHLKNTVQSFLLGMIPFYRFVAENNLIILPIDGNSAKTQPFLNK